MRLEKPSREELEILIAVADYQFYRGAGLALFGDGSDIMVYKSPNTLKIRHVYDSKGNLIVSVRADTNRFTLGVYGGLRLKSAMQYPLLRVVVTDEAVKHVREGGNVFCKHVIGGDPNIRAGCEVLIVDRDDNLLGVGKARLSMQDMYEMRSGEAVRTRRGVKRYGQQS